MRILRSQLVRIIREEVKRRSRTRGRPAASFSELQSGVAFTVRPARLRRGQRPRPPIYLKVTSAEGSEESSMPARIDAVDDAGRKYSMTDDTGRGTELYLVSGEKLVWGGSIDSIELDD